MDDAAARRIHRMVTEADQHTGLNHKGTEGSKMDKGQRKTKIYLYTLATVAALTAFKVLSGEEFVGMMKVGFISLVAGNAFEHWTSKKEGV